MDTDIGEKWLDTIMPCPGTTLDKRNLSGTRTLRVIYQRNAHAETDRIAQGVETLVAQPPFAFFDGQELASGGAHGMREPCDMRLEVLFGCPERLLHGKAWQEMSTHDRATNGMPPRHAVGETQRGHNNT